MTEKEKIVLSIAGGLVTVVIGYLVWRHEHAVSQSDSATQQAQNQADDEAYLQQLESTIGNTPAYSYGAGASGEPLDNGTASGLTPVGSSELDAILSAFFSGQNPSTGTGTSTGTSTGPGTPTGANPGGPAQPVPGAGGIQPITPIKFHPVGPTKAPTTVKAQAVENAVAS